MESTKGQLLIASPRLLDGNFRRTVVLMVEHNEQGALGLVLNRPLRATVRSIWKQVSKSPCTIKGVVYQGGPCEGPLMVLHGDPSHSEMRVLEGVYFSTNRTEIERLMAEKQPQLRFFVGYAGWAAGQLESEMEQGGWLLAPASAELVFGDVQQIWLTIMRRLGRAALSQYVDPRLIPEDPSLN